MSWTIGKPQDNWKDAEKMSFLREVWTRLKCANSFTWNAPNVAANSIVDTTLTTATVEVLKGLRAGMPVYVSPPSTIESGIAVVGAWAPADDQLTIRLANLTGGDINPASGTWSFAGVII